MSSNPLVIEELFTQLHNDIQKRVNALAGDVQAGGLLSTELRIDSYARLIAAHPENTHDNPYIPSTEVLLKTIDSSIETYGKYAATYTPKDGHAIAAKAFTRIIAGRK